MNKNKKKLSKIKKRESLKYQDSREYTLKTVQHHQTQINNLLKKPVWSVAELEKLELYFRSIHENIVKAMSGILDKIEKEAEKLDATVTELKPLEEPNGQEAA